MSDDLLKRLREAAYLDLYGVHRDVEQEAANRIEELEKQLSLINNTLNVTLSEPMTASWREFCEALIDETRELLGETNE